MESSTEGEEHGEEQPQSSPTCVRRSRSVFFLLAIVLVISAGVSVSQLRASLSVLQRLQSDVGQQLDSLENMKAGITVPKRKRAKHVVAFGRTSKTSAKDDDDEAKGIVVSKEDDQYTDPPTKAESALRRKRPRGAEEAPDDGEHSDDESDDHVKDHDGIPPADAALTEAEIAAEVARNRVLQKASAKRSRDKMANGVFQRQQLEQQQQRPRGAYYVGRDGRTRQRLRRPTPAPPIEEEEPAAQATADDQQRHSNGSGGAGSSLRRRIAVVSLNAKQHFMVGKSNGKGSGTGSDWMHEEAYINKREYCKKWGIDLIIEGSEVVDTSRAVPWSKINVIEKWLPKYEWLMWMDMDAMFMKSSVSPDLYLNDAKDLVITKDWHGINMGIFFIKNSPFSRQLLKDLWHSPRNWWVPWEEQSALITMLDATKRGQLAHKLLLHVEFVPQRSFNSYPMQFSYGNQNALYRKDDWVAHFPNCKHFTTCERLVTMFYKQALKDIGIQGDPRKRETIPETVYPPQSDESADEAAEKAEDEDERPARRRARKDDQQAEEVAEA